MSSNNYPANIVTENGDSFIPASQRPDGTWRKARRVKEGYVPQEEVPLYESKGKQFMNRKPEPVKLQTGEIAHRPIPGLFILDDKKPTTNNNNNSKKKAKKVEDITVQLQKTKLTEKPTQSEASDPAKKIKNLKKKVREIEALEEKIANKQISKPEPEQLAKIKRKADLLVQIHELEKTLN